MLLNGLGFNARTLHMFPVFHADKPLDKLIRPSIEPEHINDSVLNRAPDQLFESVSEVYLSPAVKAVNVLKLPCKALNLESAYKSQQSVERGFRFLKSPEFMVSSLLLKKPERIEALLMVMPLCLLVYAANQHRTRNELKWQSRFPGYEAESPPKPDSALGVFLLSRY